MESIGAKAALAVAGVVVLCAASVAIAAVLKGSGTSGGQITSVSVTRQDAPTSTSGTTFVTVPSSGTRVSVSDGSDLILARFSAESACFNSPPAQASTWCSVRLVLVDASTSQPVAELFPQSGIDFAFDSTNAGAEGSASWESHSMDRSIRVGNGSYSVRAEYATTGATTILRLDDWSLTVERAN